MIGIFWTVGGLQIVWVPDGREFPGVGLKAGTGNEEMRNEEMENRNEEMVTILRAEPWVIYWQKLY